MRKENMNDIIIHDDALDKINSHMNNIDVKFDTLTKDIENLNTTLRDTNKSILMIGETLTTIGITLATLSNNNSYYNSYPGVAYNPSYYKPYQSNGSYMSYYDFCNSVLASLSNIKDLLAVIAGSINEEKVKLNDEQQPSKYNNSHGPFNPFSNIKMSDYLSDMPLDPYVKEARKRLDEEAHERLDKSLSKQKQIDEMNKK